jgi:hypothetical protein
VLQGLDPAALPALYGYNGSSPKNTALTQLASPQGHPLLATWQYGLGRSAAWTSDLKGRWAVDWLGWEGFSRFAAQLVGWTLPAPQVEGVTAQAGLENGQAVVRVEAEDANGQPRNFLSATATLIGPDLQPHEIALSQVGAGRYEGSLAVSEPGTYLVRMGVNQGDQSLGQQTLGLVVPYSPEYRQSGMDLGLLNELARLTGGSHLTDPLAAFVHNLPAADYAREIWRTLLLLVALLFPLDVALRRVIFGRTEMRKAATWLRERLPFGRRRTVAGERALGQLFRARERARTRRAVQVPRQAVVRPEPEQGPQNQPVQPVESPAPPPEPAAPEEDTLARLRGAKRRAQK